MSSFSAFSPMKTEPRAAASPCLCCFDGVGGVGAGGDLLCHPDLLPSVQFSSDIRSSSTRKQHFSEIMSNSVIFCV